MKSDMAGVMDNMVINHRCFLRDEQATIQAGANVAQYLQSGMTVFLDGTLGAGKTTITRGILYALGHLGTVKSPTYTLVEPYEHLSLTVYHFDLYRLGNAEELEYMGVRDYFTEHSLCLVEWPEKGQNMLPTADVVVQLSPWLCKRTQAVGRELILWVTAN